MEPNFQDSLNWYMDKDISEIIGKEIIYYSNKIQKIKTFSLKQDPALLLTNVSLYVFQNKKLKRQVKYEEIIGITFSMASNELVIHVKQTDDFHFSSNDKTLIIYIIGKCYENLLNKSLILCEAKEKSLKQYVTTKKDKKKDNNNSKLNENNRIDTLTFIIDNDPVETNKRSYTELPGSKTPCIFNIYENPNNINNKTIFSNDNKIKEILFEDFNIIKIIGRGISGKILLVKNKFNEEYYALKYIDKKYFEIEPSKLEKIKTFTKNLIFPFLVNVNFCLETDDRIYFVFSYIQGENLFYNIYKNKNLDEEKIKFYSSIIGLTFDYLYKNGIEYNSFSSKNILIDKDGYLKLIPFHIGTIFPIKKNDKNKYKKIVEKYKNEYSPPEIFLENDKCRGKSTYWWNLGILIFEMIYSITPFFTDVDEELKIIITNNELKFPKNPKISESLKDLISKLLNKKVEERLGYQNGFEDIKKHEFFKDYNFDQLLSKEIEPSYKPLINSILENNKKIEGRFTYEDLKKCANFK